MSPDTRSPRPWHATIRASADNTIRSSAYARHHIRHAEGRGGQDHPRPHLRRRRRPREESRPHPRPPGFGRGRYQDRDAEQPRLVKITSWELPDALAKAHAAGFDYVLIDTPGRDEPATTAAIRAADFCLVPCRPTPVDLKATPPTVATITRLAEPGFRHSKLVAQPYIKNLYIIYR